MEAVVHRHRDLLTGPPRAHGADGDDLPLLHDRGGESGQIILVQIGGQQRVERVPSARGADLADERRDDQRHPNKGTVVRHGYLL
jgi:hypothetical protein